MMNDMRRLAQAYLASLAGAAAGSLEEQKQRLGSLCEPREPGNTVYVLFPQSPGVAAMRRQQLQEGQSWRLPFVKVAPNAGYLVPVFKVERSKGGKSSKRETTLAAFQEVAQSAEEGEACDYFKAVREILGARRFIGMDGRAEREVDHAYNAAVAEIVRVESQSVGGKRTKAEKATPLLTVAIDPTGQVWPGDDPRLVKWLLRSPRRQTIYGECVRDLPPDARCPLCGSSEPLFDNAPAGAGLNFVNGDFRGSFPEMRQEKAWLRFGICGECADLLYVYKYHVAPQFIDEIWADECFLNKRTKQLTKALVVPAAGARDDMLAEFVRRFAQAMAGDRRSLAEKGLLKWMARNEVPFASVSLIWAEFGQKFETIRGLVSHVLPSRLAQLERDVHDPLNERMHPFYPQNLEIKRKIDLNLRLAAELLRRPESKHFKHLVEGNRSNRRFTVLQEVGRSVFHGIRLPDDRPWWQEINETAQAYWVRLLEMKNEDVLYQSFREGPNRKRATRPPLTLCGWARHVYLFLDYLRHDYVNVLRKEDCVYIPTEESLRPLFAEARGLDTPAKRFAFLLGVIYGHLIYVQAQKAGVNVAANALSWLRGGRMRADDLPELHGKITSKLLEYHTLKVGNYKKYERIYALEGELARQGIQVGCHIDPKDLPDDLVLYFLMLGLALSYTFTKPEVTTTGEGK